MVKVYIFGIGKGKKYLDRCLLKNDVTICGYIDNYKAELMKSFEGTPVVKQSELQEEYDYIVITLMQYQAAKRSLIQEGVSEEKIISFFDFDDASKEENWCVIDSYKWRTELMWRHYTEITIPTINNYGYELYADKLTLEKYIPDFVSADETVRIVKEEKKCLARFGDNEFEMILGRRRTNYQETNASLGARLKEVLESDMDNLLIGIADNYGSLDKYTDAAASDIRRYLGNGTREEHMHLLNLNRIYYDAYLSRPYMIYRDKQGAKERFRKIREIWEKQDVLVVEGENTRFGVGNDLLNNAKSVERILTLDKDCFNVYDEIFECVKKYGKQKLILIILGPVATIMAYDLAKIDYWAVDIGQLDVEYEWYLRQVEERCDIPYKTVSEVSSYDEIETDTTRDYIKKYQTEIIKYIK